MKTITSQVLLILIAIGAAAYLYLLNNSPSTPHQAATSTAMKLGTKRSTPGPHGDLVVTITGAGPAECLHAVIGAAEKDDATHTFVINGRDYDFPPWGLARPIWDACDNDTNDIRITETKLASPLQHRKPSPDIVFADSGPGWVKITIKNKGKDKCVAAIGAITWQEGMDLEVSVDGVKGHVDHADPMKVAQALCTDKSEELVVTLNGPPPSPTTTVN